MTENVWTHIWSRDFTDDDKTDIEREVQTVRWKKIKQLILSKFKSFSNLKVIEIGAGRGTYALLTSLEGAKATLLDNNPLALEKAEAFFQSWNQSAEKVEADAFHLRDDLIGKFDIAMSYGFAEHFRYPERFEIFQSHIKLLKPGGLLIVSVPNSAFLPYRAGKFLLEKMGKWMLGLEIPFSKKELLSVGEKLKVENFRVVGSGVVGDFLNFWFVQRFLHLPHYLMDKTFSFLSKKQIKPLKDHFHYFSYDPNTPLDDFWGYAMVLVAEKK